MKKHFLFSTMFALTAALSYGQATTATTGTAPTPVTCTDDALHPIIGKEYTYKGTGTPAGGTYHIFATNSTNFIQNGALNTTGAYTAANPSFVVIQYKQNGTCTTDNLKVYKIEPKNAFIIEIRNMKKGTGNNFTTEALNTNIDVCSANIQSATYNGTKMVYNYGSQSFYYELIAANYDKDFTPKVKIDGLQTGQTAKLKWGYSKTTMNTEIASVTNNTEVTLPKIIADTAIEPSKGVSIYLELVVENGSYEGTTDKNITLSVDATSGTKNFKNVKRTDCSDEADFADKAIQVLKARPAISPNTGVNFITQ